LENIAISVNDVSMRFNLARERIDTLKEHVIARLKRRIIVDEFYALRNVSFQVEKGESFAIVGSNGSGKSTLMKLVAKVYKPTTGSITVNGAIAPMIEIGAGFDAQLTASENIFLNGMILGYKREFVKSKYDEILDFAELRQFENVPLKNISSGMQARLGFAVATLMKPDILIVDEILSVGDYHFQKKSKERIAELLSGGTTLLLVSHARDIVTSFCKRAIWIEKGKIRASGDAESVCAQYQPKALS
jgi:ABC-type polysaccharide/polyol phosphate transport system ATPase subunit